MTEPLSYRITAISRAACKRVHIFTWIGSAEHGVSMAKRDAFDRGLIGEFSDFRAELVVDTTRHYRTRAGHKVTIHEIVTHNSVGEEVTYPIKCSIREQKKHARSRYQVLTIAGYGHPKPGGRDDIVGFWNEEQ